MVQACEWLRGAISGDEKHFIELKCRKSSAWMRFQKHSFHLYDRPDIPLSPKIRFFEAGEVNAMLLLCATWTLRREDFGSLSTAHRKLLLRAVGGCIGHKPSSYEPVVEMINI